jgi:hypothetical protein
MADAPAFDRTVQGVLLSTRSEQCRVHLQPAAILASGLAKVLVETNERYGTEAGSGLQASMPRRPGL